MCISHLAPVSVPGNIPVILSDQDALASLSSLASFIDFDGTAMAGTLMRVTYSSIFQDSNAGFP
jgi:hypothetical protein